MQALLSPDQVDRLLTQRTITDAHPWVTDDDDSIEAHLKAACAAVNRATGCESKVEWDHYGSGYASYVDAWFYKPIPEFLPERRSGIGEEYTGLVVLFSRLSPYVAFMEGVKQWHAKGSSSYMPAFSALDRLETPAVSSLARQVQAVLEAQGFIRVLRAQLEAPLAPGVRVPTNLADGGFIQFDALFHWED